MRIALIADSHIAASAPAFVSKWRAAAEFAARSRTELTIHLGDITLDAINGVEQLDFARKLIDRWPTPVRVLPGNHDIAAQRNRHAARRAVRNRVGAQVTRGT